MTIDTLIAVCIFGLAICLVPGPNNIMLASTGANFGMRRGMGHFWGVVLGFGSMIFLACLGLGSLLEDIPSLLYSLRIFAALAIVWLSFRIMTSPISTLSDTGSAEKAATLKPITFLEAFSFQCINPKTWAVSTSLVALHWQKDESILWQSFIFALVFAFVSLFVSLIWMNLGVFIRRHLLRTPALARTFNIFMGLLLSGTLLFLFL